MLCTVKKTLEIIKETKNDAIIQVKRNQHSLYTQIKELTESLELKDCFEYRDKKNHGRLEERRVEVFNIPDHLKHLSEWFKYIFCIVKVTRIRQEFKTKTKKYRTSVEISYYISTMLLTAKQAYRVIRDHWLIENANNYVKDQTFQEDYSRIRKNPFNFNCLRSFALNIFRINKFENITEARYKHTLDFEKCFILKGISQN